jgi:hypothetical protein
MDRCGAVAAFLTVLADHLALWRAFMRPPAWPSQLSTGWYHLPDQRNGQGLLIGVTPDSLITTL